jgi:hypothetical protein
MVENDRNTSNVGSILDHHLARLSVLSTQIRNLDKYIANSILMMIPQILAMRYYSNGSWQNSLSEFETALRLESMLSRFVNKPTLVFARSSELLAMHLMLIYEDAQDQWVRSISDRKRDEARLSVLAY